MTIVAPDASQIIELARLFLFVREAQQLGQNQGLRVNAIQLWSGGKAGESWCAHFATMILDLVYQGRAPIIRTGSCQMILDIGRQKNIVFSEPQVGDLFLYLNNEGRAHHVGFVSDVNPLIGIAGNTSSDGKSVNGDRVAEHEVSARVFVRYLGAA